MPSSGRSERGTVPEVRDVTDARRGEDAPDVLADSVAGQDLLLEAPEHRVHEPVVDDRLQLGKVRQ
jgi:hypothetical protein